MKKITILSFVLFLSACGSNTLSVKTLDDYINDDAYLFIDIRNPEEAYTDGYIEGFTFLPLYGYLFEEDILRPPSGGVFRSSDILDRERLESHLDNTKIIVIICRTGNRTDYFETVLKSLGYDVINLGGIHDYRGDLLKYPEDGFNDNNSES